MPGDRGAGLGRVLVGGRSIGPATSDHLEPVGGTVGSATHPYATVFTGVMTGGGMPAVKAATYARVLANPAAIHAALDWHRANPLPAPAALGPIHVRTLYLYGTHDPCFAPSTAAATGRYARAPYTFVPVAGVGHWLPQDAPARVTAALLRFLGARRVDA